MQTSYKLPGQSLLLCCSRLMLCVTYVMRVMSVINLYALSQLNEVVLTSKEISFFF